MHAEITPHRSPTLARGRHLGRAFGRLVAGVTVFVLAWAAPARAETFSGPDASDAAGDFLTRALGYPPDYNPGRLAVRYVPVYLDGFMSNVRFSPSRGHQVVLAKSLNAPDLQAGGHCADVRIVVEHFSAESLERYNRQQSGVRLLVEREDALTARICVGADDTVRVALREARLATPVAARPAFATPFGVGGDAGGGI